MAQIGERRDIELAIRRVWDYVVRGRAASKNRAVRLAKLQKLVAICATALTSLGLASPLLQAIQDKELNLQELRHNYAGLPLFILLLGGGLIAAIVIANHVMKEEAIEKKAILSQALADSFDDLGHEVDDALPWPDPLEQLEQHFENAVALQRYSAKLMADGRTLQQTIDTEVDQRITKYCAYWDSKEGVGERR